MRIQCLKFVFISVIACLLYGCMNATVTGAQAVYDRHNLKNSLNNHYITMKAYQDIYANSDRYKNTNISISTLNNVVLLTGQIPSPDLRLDAEKKVRQIPGVKEVYNLTQITTPSSSLTRMSDAWITTKIKAKLIATDELDPDQIKVVTENGTVYLMGILPPQQAKIAVNIAKRTEGVQSVVKIFSYLRITKT